MEDNKQTISVDGVEYDFNELSETQQVIVNHLADLENKLAAARFNLDQLQVGRDAFYKMLKAEIGKDETKVTED
jgi:hypothetical protein